jgi:hypothetical protein
MFQVRVHVLQRPVLRLYLGRDSVLFRVTCPAPASPGPGILAMTLFSGEWVGKAVAGQQQMGLMKSDEGAMLAGHVRGGVMF